ncbi:hypothetical protein BZL29_0478 [Mycobacterium kansasii]|uniref:Uncharacterized protein n=1 Tax=Mycobacterium kansasii TaxID=1768 RepID=A0A1V3XVQ8_MYCKA|nr:hypothetical protein BZL29_0478 [Mycobacterium kansasii]
MRICSGEGDGGAAVLDSAARPPGAELMCAPTITPAMPAPKTLTTTAAINPARRTPDGRRTFGGTPACAYAGGPGDTSAAATVWTYHVA